MTKRQLSLSADSHFAPILQRIREETSKILKIPFERFFTDHSVEGHSTRILQHLYGLTDGLRVPLCEDEKYILIASAYLHDISLAWENDMDFLALRKDHPKLSGDLVRRIAKGEQIRGIQCDFGLPQSTSRFGMHGEYIARVVEGHGGTTTDIYFTDVVLNNSKIRVRFLADLLAFADELDLHRDRVDPTRLAQCKMLEADIFHWWKHWFVIGVRVEKLGNVQISYAFPEEMRKNQEFPDLVQKYVKLRLQNEYAKVEPTLAQEGVSLHLPPATKDFSDIAAPGKERPSSSIVDLFRNAVSSLLPSAQLEPDEVSRNIALATQYLMGGMLPAGVGYTLYVRRRDSEERFENFIERATEQLFLLAGRPGTGKTMFILRMANKYPTFTLVYRYAGDTQLPAEADLPQYVVEQYASIITNKLQAKKHRELDIRKLEEMARSKGKCVILHLESNLSLNDLREPDGLLYRLAQTIRERNIKVCLTCVADIGETLSISHEVARMIYQPPSQLGVVAPSSVLEDYSEEEFADACLRYFGERSVNLSEADLKDEARDRLKHPLWLDIYSMARSEYPRPTRIETSIRYVEVCESFLTNRSMKAANILNIAEGEHLVQLCLNKMAVKMMSILPPLLERRSVEELISTVFPAQKGGPSNILEAMRKAGLVKESFYGNRPEVHIGFAFGEIREYLFAKQSAVETLLWTPEATAETVRKKFSEALCDAEKRVLSPYGTGVLEFLILLLEHTVRKEHPIVLKLPQIDIRIVNELLGDLISSGIERGEQVCARVLGKLEEYPNDLPYFLDMLSHSPYAIVRRDLTYSLSALSRETQGSTTDAREILSGLVNDGTESVACCAVAALVKSFENEEVPPTWVDRFTAVCQLPMRGGLVTTMTCEFGRRTFLNTKEFLPGILRNMCLRDKSDPHIAAAACDCLSKKWRLIGEDALVIVCDTIDKFRNTRQGEIVLEQAIPALISMGPYFQKEVYQFLENKARLKKNEYLKCLVARNSRKLSAENREKLLEILQKDESPMVRAWVLTAKSN